MKFLSLIQQFLFSNRIRKTKPVIVPLQGKRIKNILIVSSEDNFDASLWLENFQLSAETSLNFLCVSNATNNRNTTDNHHVTLIKTSFGFDLFPRTSWLTQQKRQYDMIILNNKEENSMVESTAISLSSSYKVSIYPTKFAHFYHVVLHSNTISEKDLILELKNLLLKTLPL